MLNEILNPFNERKEQNAIDIKLINETLNGNKASFEKLCLRHQPWIYNIAFRMVLVHEDAEDITQEILIKLITNLSTFDSSKAAFRVFASQDLRLAERSPSS